MDFSLQTLKYLYQKRVDLFGGFSYLIPVFDLADQVTEQQFIYDATKNTVKFFINGLIVFWIDNLGCRLSNDDYMSGNEGGEGIEITAEDMEISVSHIHLLDSYSPCMITIRHGILASCPRSRQDMALLDLGRVLKRPGSNRAASWSHDNSEFFGQSVCRRI